MTTRDKLLKTIAKAARRKGLEWELVREGGNLSIYELDGLRVPAGRHHGEIGERYAEMIYKQFEPKLGRRWWR